MNRKSSALISEGDVDTLSLDEVIRSKLLTAAKLVEMEAPVRMLESGHLFTDDSGNNVFIEGTSGKGYIILPEDFMRLISFRMSDWDRTVYDPISETDPLYSLQSSKWKGVYGSPEKPVVAIVRRGEGKVLEFYSCKTADAYVVQSVYQPYPKEENGGIDLPEQCYEAVVYRAAALTLASTGDQLTTTMMEISKGMLED